jgi:hypothetical protein
MPRSWRDIIRPIISKILQETEGQSEAVRKKALFDAYPFGERKYLPYKVWLDEIKIQTCKKKFRFKKERPNPDQSELFTNK